MAANEGAVRDADYKDKIIGLIKASCAEQKLIELIRSDYNLRIHNIDFYFDYSDNLNIAFYTEDTDEWYKLHKSFSGSMGGVMGNVIKDDRFLNIVETVLEAVGVEEKSIVLLCYDYSMLYKGECMVRLIKRLLKFRFYSYWYTYHIIADKFYVIIEVEDEEKLKSVLDNANGVKDAVRHILESVDIQGRLKDGEIGFAVGLSKDIIGRDTMHCVNEESLDYCYEL